MNSWCAEDFLGSETILNDTVMVAIRHTFVKINKMYN